MVKLVIIDDNIDHAAETETYLKNQGCKVFTINEINEIAMPALIFWKDINSKYIGSNQAFAKFYGIQSPEDIFGKNDFELSWYNEAEKYQREDLRILNETSQFLDSEYKSVTAEGLEVWFKRRKHPLHDSKGNLIGILGIHEYITIRMEADLNLKESKETYRKLVDNSQDLLYRTNQKAIVTFISQSAKNLAGYTVEEAVGTNMAQDVYETPEIRQAFLSELMQNGKIRNFENKLRRPDGSVWWGMPMRRC